MAEFDIVVIAGSQGGLDACQQVFAHLTPDLTACVIVVQHRLPDKGMLAAIVRRYTPMPVLDCEGSQPTRPGTVLIAPASGQLYARPDRRATVDLSGGPPRADAVMSSAADVYGPRVLAVVLSGRLDDGAEGVRAVKRAGGRVIVQTPASAAWPSMPTAALATGCVDLCLEPARIGAAISTFVTVPGSAALFGGRPASWAWRVGA